MSRADCEALGVLAVIIILICGIFYGVYATVMAVHSYQCDARWEGSPYTTQHTFAGGCRVSPDEGEHWFPEKAIREW